MKKKVVVSTCAVAIAGTLAVGGVLAYLHAQTDTVRNVFTGEQDNLKGHIEEEFEQDKADHYVPGDVITKKPHVVNESDSITAWVAVKVKINVADETISYDEFAKNYGTIQTKFADTYKDGFNTGDNGAFEELNTDGKDYKLFIYKQEVPKNTATADIFDRVEILSGVKSVYASSTETKNVWKEVKKADYDASSAQKKEDNGRYFVLESSVSSTTYDPEADYFVDKNGKLTSVSLGKLPHFDIDVTGYMVQSQNVDYETAKTELINLAAKYE